MARILVVDDEALILNVLKTVLSSDGHEPVAVQDGPAALELLHSQSFDLMISDLRMSPMDGIEILKKVRADKITIPVIMMTGYGTVKSAIDALSLNVFDYVSKPFKVEEFLATIRQALLYGQAEAGEQTTLDDFSSAYKLGSLIAASQAMLKVCDMIKRVGPVDVPVLISGEYGVGRETIARTIHECSPRKASKFLSVPCGELPEPLFDALMFGNASEATAAISSESRGFLAEAEGGTLLLTDADMIPSSIQEKLVTIIQGGAAKGKTVAEVRFIGATTDKPDSAPSPDADSQLFHRLGAVEIRVPALRERREDILALAIHILKQKVDQGKSIPLLAPDARDALVQYSWPGNVSELDKAIEHGLAHLSDNKITRQSLPPRLLQQEPAAGAVSKGKKDQMFGKQKALKAFLSKPLQALKTQGVAASPGSGR